MASSNQICECDNSHDNETQQDDDDGDVKMIGWWGDNEPR